MRKSLIASLNFLTFTFGMLLVFSMTTSANGSVVIFSDDFSTDPAGNGWSIATTNSGTVTTTGSEALFDNVASMTTPPTTWSMTRSFSTVGFTSVSLDLSAFQSNAANGFEGVEPNRDFLQIQYDTGSGFMNLVQDFGEWKGIDGDTTSGSNTASTSLVGGPLALTGADNLASLTIRINGFSTDSDEDYYIDSVTVTGVPEPTSFALFGLALVGFARRRR